MKKLVILLFAGLLMTPSGVFGKKYDRVKVTPPAPPPHRVPSLYQIGVEIDHETGDLLVCPNYDITGLTITLTRNGVAYLDTTVSLPAGQSYADSLDFLEEGTYILTLSTADGTIAQYEITVEDD